MRLTLFLALGLRTVSKDQFTQGYFDCDELTSGFDQSAAVDLGFLRRGTPTPRRRISNILFDLLDTFILLCPRKGSGSQRVQ